MRCREAAPTTSISQSPNLGIQFESPSLMYYNVPIVLGFLIFGTRKQNRPKEFIICGISVSLRFKFSMVTIGISDLIFDKKPRSSWFVVFVV